MFENSLRIREKYVNKIKSKVDSLMESVSLLEKVDRQLMNDQVQMGGARLNKLIKSYNKLQSGGALPQVNSNETNQKNISMTELQETVLGKKVDIHNKQTQLDELRNKIDNLSQSFEPINKTLLNVKQLIESISIVLPDLEKAEIPSFVDWSVYAEYNLYHNIQWNKMVMKKDLIKDGNKNFTVFNVPPSDGDVILDDKQKEDYIIKYIRGQYGNVTTQQVIDMYNNALRKIHPQKDTNIEEVERLTATPTSSLNKTKVETPSVKPVKKPTKSPPATPLIEELKEKQRERRPSDD
jgi:hypothetical protein